jgi:DNA-binding PadR family transcriptional regulator
MDPLYRKIFLGLIEVHILHHASKAPFYGSWMMNELSEHGYQVGPGLMYPLLKELCANRWLTMEKRVEDGRQKKYYSITEDGLAALDTAKLHLRELTKELTETASS